MIQVQDPEIMDYVLKLKNSDKRPGSRAPKSKVAGISSPAS